MDYRDFIAAGQRCGGLTVFLTLMATILGASATLGVAAKAETIGFPAAWWLFSGAVGLALQGVALSARIRASGACTLPELAGLKAGPSARRLVAVVIGLSWPAVIAAQLIAFAGLWNAFAGTEQRLFPITVCAGAVVLYTLAGGQRAVVRTDGPQMAILTVGFGGLFFWAFSGRCGGTPLPSGTIRLFSPDFTAWDAALSLLTVGGAYFLGPDIASRSLVARDGPTARRAVLAAAPALVVFGAAIALAGIWAGANVPGAGNPILRIAVRLPIAVRICLEAGLFCAILSSVDTCLMNAAAIVAGDLFEARSVRASRMAVAVIGGIAAVLAAFGGDIIGVLLKAYSVYTPGVVCPLAVAIIAGQVNHRLWLAAVALGGLCGLAGTLVPGGEILPAVGMGVSLLLALAATVYGKGRVRDGSTAT
ncbi:MAG: sodium:solute symporter [Kiritimatiellae bacterium]|nr:sodium:solute symporter [Kiritimatiellia bacterium]